MMKIILLTAYSPRFNHIPSVRIQKLAKYLSHYSETTVIAGMPDISEDSAYYNKSPDIGSATLTEIKGRSLSKRFSMTSERERNLSSTPEKLESLKQKAKLFFGPFAQLLLPISSGGMILYRRREFVDEIEREIAHSNQPVVLFSSYNPWFILDIAEEMRRKHNILLCADFRDPPFNSPKEKGTFLPLFRYRTLRALKTADVVTAVNDNMINSFRAMLDEPTKFLRLNNGFDPDDLSVEKRIDSVTSSEIPLKGKDDFWIVYTGRFYPNTGGDIDSFARVLKKLETDESPLFAKLRFVYVGSHSSYVETVFCSYGLSSILINCGHSTRKIAIRIQSMADLLLLISYTYDDDIKGSGIITGKIYEYFMHQCPILVIGTPNWEMKTALLSDNVSALFSSKQIQEMAAYIEEIPNKIKDFRKNERSKCVERFSHPSLANMLFKKFEEVVEKRFSTAK